MRHRLALAAAALAAAWTIPAQGLASGQTAGGPGCPELARIVQLLPGGPQVFPTEGAANGNAAPAPVPAPAGTPPAPRGPGPGSPPASPPTGPVRTTLLPPGALRATVTATPAGTRYVADLYEAPNRRGGDRGPQVLRYVAERVAACYRGVRPTREPNGTAEDNIRFIVAPNTEIALLLDAGSGSVSLSAIHRTRR